MNRRILRSPDACAWCQSCPMEFGPEEALLLKDLVKAARQRPHHVPWVDRDGSPRMTVFRPEEFARINAIARRYHASPAEILRQAAHIPVRRSAEPAGDGLDVG